MGLFDVFRRKPTTPTGATSSTSSTLTASAPSTPAAPESSVGAAPAADFDALFEAMRRNEPGAEQRFWNAVFRLERLHFYSSKPPAKIIADNDAAPPLFIGLSDGRPMLHVFTDSKRAHAFGVERQEAQGTLQQGVTVLELPTEHLPVQNSSKPQIHTPKERMLDFVLVNRGYGLKIADSGSRRSSRARPAMTAARFPACGGGRRRCTNTPSPGC